MPFHTVARRDEMAPDTMRCVDVSGTSVVLFNAGGEFFACKNLCPHRGGPLDQGDFDGRMVMCPWHGWQFDVRDGRHPHLPAARLDMLAVRVEGDDIQVQVG